MTHVGGGGVEIFLQPPSVFKKLSINMFVFPLYARGRLFIGSFRGFAMLSDEIFYREVKQMSERVLRIADKRDVHFMIVMNEIMVSIVSGREGMEGAG